MTLLGAALMVGGFTALLAFRKDLVHARSADRRPRLETYAGSRIRRHRRG
ncbi:hypothetical protein GCM10010201_22970 [Pilimelia columellifera subsp. columellifera]|uniref:Uncharacterized protein n=2 Tax=Pilimelia TaxID=53370 RepID=A0ABP6AUJ8_9ACTN